MLALHKSLKSAHNPQEADRITREVESVGKSVEGEIGKLTISPKELKNAPVRVRGAP